MLTVGFTQTNLVSDIPGMAATTDPNLVNPWGIAFGQNSGIWVANNHSGTATVYDLRVTSQRQGVAESRSAQRALHACAAPEQPSERGIGAGLREAQRESAAFYGAPLLLFRRPQN